MKRTPLRESESVIVLTELLKLKEIGQFPGDPVKIEDTQIIPGVYIPQLQLLVLHHTDYQI